MVARAIMHKPQILFLDEPTAGLDPQSRIALWEIMQELHADGQTILLTTHYMEEADQLCDRVAIMDHGRILALDTAAGLKREPGRRHHRAHHRRPATSTGWPSACWTASTAPPTPGSSTARCMLWASGGGLLPRIIEAAEADGVEVTDLSVSEPTLETVFINLTGKDLRE